MNKFQVSYWLVAFFFIVAVIGMAVGLWYPASRKVLLSTSSIDRWVSFLILAYLFYTLKDWQMCAMAEMPAMQMQQSDSSY